MVHNQSFILEPHETEALLDRLQDWRFGICPNGTLASKACFVLDQRPNIVVIPEAAKPLTTYLITSSKWTYNLTDIGVISHLSDSTLLQTLADAYLIFESFFQNKTSGLNQAHAIRIQKYATISIENILRPTGDMERSIEGVLSEPNAEARWSRLLGFWDTYGYFWPRKIVLGFKQHFSKGYTFNDRAENANTYQSIHRLLKEQMNKVPTQKDPYDLHDFMNNSVIAGRRDLTPIHELLNLEYKEKITSIIEQRFIKIPIASHLKIYNPASNSYLAWCPRHSRDKHGDNFVIRPISKDALSTLSDKQYIWRLTCDVSSTMRGNSSIYIHPSCQTKLRKQNSVYLTDDSSMLDSTILVDTHKMILTCQPFQMENDPKVNVRPLRLRRPEELINENEMKWSIEYPGNELKYATDLDFQIKLNVDEHIRKLKPLIQGDIIQLKQIGLLTSFDTSAPNATQENYVQSLRRVKRLPQLEESKMKSRKAFMCVNEEDTYNGYATNAQWQIELATEVDLERHYHGLKNLEGLQSRIIVGSSPSDDADMLYSLHSDSSVLTSSLSEVHLDNRAQYFENLAKSSTSKLLYGFIKKVTLDPLAQIVVPSKDRKQNTTEKY